MSEQNVEQRIFRPQQAAQFLGVSTGLLERWRERGEGPRWFKIGLRAVGYDRADLEKWVVSKKGSESSAAAAGGAQ